MNGLTIKWQRVVLMLVLPLLFIRHVLTTMIDLPWYQYNVYWYVFVPLLLVLLSVPLLRKKLILQKDGYIVFALLLLILSGSQLLYSEAIFQWVKSVDSLRNARDFPQYKFFKVTGQPSQFTFDDFKYTEEIKQENITRRRANRRMKEGLHFNGMVLKNVTNTEDTGEIVVQLWLAYEMNHYIRDQYQPASEDQKSAYLSEVEKKISVSSSSYEFELMGYAFEKDELRKKIDKVFPAKVGENDWLFIPKRNKSTSTLFWSIGLMIVSYIAGLLWLRRTRKSQ